MIGTDSELFVVDRDGYLVHPADITTGKKDKPEEIGNNCSLQQDGATIEFATPPCKDWTEMRAYVNYCLKTIQSRLKDGEVIHDVISRRLSQDEIDQNPSFSEFGCDPDISAYDGERNAIEISDNIRFAGGHLHIDLDTKDPNEKIRMVKILDKNLSPISASLYQMSGADSFKRISNYGAPGIFRDKPYGLEYRSMPTGWFLMPALGRQVFQMINLSYKEFEEGVDPEDSFQFFNKNHSEAWERLHSSVVA